jgi:hypothetical protein
MPVSRQWAAEAAARPAITGRWWSVAACLTADP